MATDSKLHLRIASPCKAPWENMDGDNRVRFCRECSRNVYNLSAMTEPEARRVIAEREGRLCESGSRSWAARRSKETGTPEPVSPSSP